MSENVIAPHNFYIEIGIHCTLFQFHTSVRCINNKVKFFHQTIRGDQYLKFTSNIYSTSKKIFQHKNNFLPTNCYFTIKNIFYIQNSFSFQKNVFSSKKNVLHLGNLYKSETEAYRLLSILNMFSRIQSSKQISKKKKVSTGLGKQKRSHIL